MRIYQRSLLVGVLSLGMIAAGIAWERCCISPLIEQAEKQPTRAEVPSPSELPAECLEELSAMGKTGLAASPRADATLVASNAAMGASQGIDNPLRPSAAAPGVEAGGEPDGPRSIAQLAHDALARRNSHVRSVEWTEPMAEPRPAERPQSGAMPGSAAKIMPHDSADDALRTADVLDVMRRLRSDDAQQRAESRRELARRGFSEVDMELARRLFDPAVEARKKLARELPRLASVDAAQWLWWLALDPDRDVRVLAVSLLATTGDTVLLDRVEGLARKDPDPQVQALADQIARQRELASRQGDALQR